MKVKDNPELSPEEVMYKRLAFNNNIYCYPVTSDMMSAWLDDRGYRWFPADDKTSDDLAKRERKIIEALG